MYLKRDVTDSGLVDQDYLFLTSDNGIDQLGCIYVNEIVKLLVLVPNTIVLDKDMRLMPTFWKSPYKSLSTKLTFSITYHF